MSLWIIEVSRDGGETWKVEQPYKLYKKKETGDIALRDIEGWRYKYRLTEYRPVEG